MKILIASDHRGFDVKKQIIEFLKKEGFDTIDFGANSNMSVDYPNFAFKLCENISGNDLGILICGTGIGMSIAANKVKGIRCARVCTIDDAKYARLHNNANVVALSSNLALEEIYRIIDTFIKTPFSKEERHIKRNNMIDKYDNKL